MWAMRAASKRSERKLLMKKGSRVRTTVRVGVRGGGARGIRVRVKGRIT